MRHLNMSAQNRDSGAGRMKLDPIKQREVCAIIAVGGSRRVAAKYVGCAPTTIRNTALRSKEFARRLARAEADFEVILLSNIQQAGKRSWNAAAWLLERIYPERYAKRQADTIPVQQLADVLSRIADVIRSEVPDPERLERLVDRMQEVLSKAFERGRRTKRNAKRSAEK